MAEMTAFDEANIVSKALGFFETDTEFFEAILKSVNGSIGKSQCLFSGDISESYVLHQMRQPVAGMPLYIVDSHTFPLALRLSNPNRRLYDYESFMVDTPIDFGWDYFKNRTCPKGEHPLLNKIAEDMVTRIKNDPARGWENYPAEFGVHGAIQEENSLTNREFSELQKTTLFQMTEESVYHTNNAGGVFRKLSRTDGKVICQFFPIKENIFPSVMVGENYAFYSDCYGREITTLPIQRLHGRTIGEHNLTQVRSHEIMLVDGMVSDTKYCPNVVEHNDIVL